MPWCLWSLIIFSSLPGSRLTNSYYDASSALLQLVNQWLNFTYSRTHAFRYGCQKKNPALIRIELDFRTSWGAGYLQGHTGDKRHVHFLLVSFISLIADGPHHYHPACGHKGSSHLSPVHALHFFIAMQVQHSYNSSNQWLNFTYSRSHAFRYERKNTNSTLVRIELTTSVLADVQSTY